MTSVVDVFAPLIGQLMWDIHRGHGSFLVMEFGKPHLQVRNPITPRHAVDAKTKEGLARRRVFPHGEWHFFIMDSEWYVSAFGKDCYCHDPKTKIDEVLACLDGQKLVSVAIEPDGKWLLLAFDMGGTLRVSLFPQVKGTCWMLSNFNTGVITAFEDGELSTSPTRQCDSGGIVTTK